MSKSAELLRQRFFLLPLDIGVAGGESFYCLFAQTQVVEVVGRAVQIYPVPFAPSYLQGCILRQDEVIPVLDVDVLCGGQGSLRRLRARQVLVIRTGQTDAANGEFMRLALASSGAVLTFKLSDREAMHPIEAIARPDGFDGQGLDRGFFRLRGHQVVVMDFDAIARGEFSYAAGAAGMGRTV